VEIQLYLLRNAEGVVWENIPVAEFNGLAIFGRTINLIRGSVNENRIRAGLTDCLDQIQRACSVDVEIKSRVDHGLRHRNLSSEMNNAVESVPGQQRIDGVLIPNIQVKEFEGPYRILQAKEIRICPSAGKIVHNSNRVGLPDCPSDEI
jgi:hypothetical protein